MMLKLKLEFNTKSLNEHIFDILTYATFKLFVIYREACTVLFLQLTFNNPTKPNKKNYIKIVLPYKVFFSILIKLIDLY